MLWGKICWVFFLNNNLFFCNNERKEGKYYRITANKNKSLTKRAEVTHGEYELTGEEGKLK